MSIGKNYGRRNVIPEPCCTVQQCDRDIEPECPAPLCKEHARQVFAWVMISAQAQSILADPIPPKPEPKKRPEDRRGWVYFIRVGPHIKIGWSSNPKHRLKSYRTYELLLLHRGTMADEKQLHRDFAHLLERGREYFHPAPDLLEHIETHMTRHEPGRVA